MSRHNFTAGKLRLVLGWDTGTQSYFFQIWGPRASTPKTFAGMDIHEIPSVADLAARLDAAKVDRTVLAGEDGSGVGWDAVARRLEADRPGIAFSAGLPEPGAAVAVRLAVERPKVDPAAEDSFLRSLPPDFAARLGRLAFNPVVVAATVVRTAPDGRVRVRIDPQTLDGTGLTEGQQIDVGPDALSRIDPERVRFASGVSAHEAFGELPATIRAMRQAGAEPPSAENALQVFAHYAHWAFSVIPEIDGRSVPVARPPAGPNAVAVGRTADGKPSFDVVPVAELRNGRYAPIARRDTLSEAVGASGPVETRLVALAGNADWGSASADGTLRFSSGAVFEWNRSPAADPDLAPKARTIIASVADARRVAAQGQIDGDLVIDGTLPKVLRAQIMAQLGPRVRGAIQTDWGGLAAVGAARTQNHDRRPVPVAIASFSAGAAAEPAPPVPTPARRILLAAAARMAVFEDPALRAIGETTPYSAADLIDSAVDAVARDANIPTARVDSARDAFRAGNALRLGAWQAMDERDRVRTVDDYLGTLLAAEPRLPSFTAGGPAFDISTQALAEAAHGARQHGRAPFRTQAALSPEIAEILVASAARFADWPTARRFLDAGYNVVLLDIGAEPALVEAGRLAWEKANRPATRAWSRSDVFERQSLARAYAGDLLRTAQRSLSFSAGHGLALGLGLAAAAHAASAETLAVRGPFGLQIASIETDGPAGPEIRNSDGALVETFRRQPDGSYVRMAPDGSQIGTVARHGRGGWAVADTGKPASLFIERDRFGGYRLRDAAGGAVARIEPPASGGLAFSAGAVPERAYVPETRAELDEILARGRVDGSLKIDLPDAELDGFRFPDGVTIEGDLLLAGIPIETLGRRLSIAGALYAPESGLKSLPHDVAIGGHVYLDASAIETLPPGLHVKGDLDVSYTKIAMLPPGLVVDRDLKAYDSPLAALPADLRVGASLMLANTRIADIDSLKSIDGDLDISGTEVRSLPAALWVSGTLNLARSRVAEIPESVFAGLTVDRRGNMLPALDPASFFAAEADMQRVSLPESRLAGIRLWARENPAQAALAMIAAGGAAAAAAFHAASGGLPSFSAGAERTRAAAGWLDLSDAAKRDFARDAMEADLAWQTGASDPIARHRIEKYDDFRRTIEASARKAGLADAPAFVDLFVSTNATGRYPSAARLVAALDRDATGELAVARGRSTLAFSAGIGSDGRTIEQVIAAAAQAESFDEATGMFVAHFGVDGQDYADWGSVYWSGPQAGPDGEDYELDTGWDAAPVAARTKILGDFAAAFAHEIALTEGARAEARAAGKISAGLAELPDSLAATGLPVSTGLWHAAVLVPAGERESYLQALAAATGFDVRPIKHPNDGSIVLVLIAFAARGEALDAARTMSRTGSQPTAAIYDPEGGRAATIDQHFSRIGAAQRAMTREELAADPNFFPDLVRGAPLDAAEAHPVFALDLRFADIAAYPAAQGKPSHPYYVALGTRFTNPVRFDSRIAASTALLGRNAYAALESVPRGDSETLARILLAADAEVGRAAQARGHDAIVYPVEVQVVDRARLPALEGLRHNAEGDMLVFDDGRAWTDASGFEAYNARLGFSAGATSAKAGPVLTFDDAALMRLMDRANEIDPGDPRLDLVSEGGAIFLRVHGGPEAGLPHPRAGQKLPSGQGTYPAIDVAFAHQADPVHMDFDDVEATRRAAFGADDVVFEFPARALGRLDGATRPVVATLGEGGDGFRLDRMASGNWNALRYFTTKTYWRHSERRAVSAEAPAPGREGRAPSFSAGSLTFDRDHVLRLVEAARTGEPARDFAENESGADPVRGLVLVGDDGIYLAPKTKNPPRHPRAGQKRDSGHGTYPQIDVAYAHQCDPSHMDFDAWWESKNRIFGGVETIPLDAVEKVLEGGRHLVIRVTPDQLAFEALSDFGHRLLADEARKGWRFSAGEQRLFRALDADWDAGKAAGTVQCWTGDRASADAIARSLPGGRVVEAQVDLRRPFVLDSDEKARTLRTMLGHSDDALPALRTDLLEHPDIHAVLAAAGYDGIIVADGTGRADDRVVGSLFASQVRVVATHLRDSMSRDLAFDRADLRRAIDAAYGRAVAGVPEERGKDIDWPDFRLVLDGDTPVLEPDDGKGPAVRAMGASDPAFALEMRKIGPDGIPLAATQVEMMAAPGQGPARLEVSRVGDLVSANAKLATEVARAPRTGLMAAPAAAIAAGIPGAAALYEAGRHLSEAAKVASPLRLSALDAQRSAALDRVAEIAGSVAHAGNNDLVHWAVERADLAAQAARFGVKLNMPSVPATIPHDLARAMTDAVGAASPYWKAVGEIDRARGGFEGFGRMAFDIYRHFEPAVAKAGAAASWLGQSMLDGIVHPVADTARLVASLSFSAGETRSWIDRRNAIAERFTEILQSSLPEQSFAEIRRRNAERPTRMHCHSHDFLDANMVMKAAFAEVAGREAVIDDTVAGQGDIALWNAAWDHAIDSGQLATTKDGPGLAPAAAFAAGAQRSRDDVPPKGFPILVTAVVQRSEIADRYQADLKVSRGEAIRRGYARAREIVGQIAGIAGKIEGVRFWGSDAGDVNLLATDRKTAERLKAELERSHLQWVARDINIVDIGKAAFAAGMPEERSTPNMNATRTRAAATVAAAALPVAMRRAVPAAVVNRRFASAAIATGLGAVAFNYADKAAREFSAWAASGENRHAVNSMLSALYGPAVDVRREVASGLLTKAHDAFRTVVESGGTDTAAMKAMEDAARANFDMSAQAVHEYLGTVAKIPGIDMKVVADVTATIDAKLAALRDAASGNLATNAESVDAALRAIHDASNAVWQAEPLSGQPAAHLAASVPDAVGRLGEAYQKFWSAQIDFKRDLFAPLEAAAPARVQPSASYLDQALSFARDAWSAAAEGATNAVSAVKGAAGDPALTAKQLANTAIAASDHVAVFGHGLVQHVLPYFEQARAAIGFSAGAEAPSPREALGAFLAAAEEITAAAAPAVQSDVAAHAKVAKSIKAGLDTMALGPRSPGLQADLIRDTRNEVITDLSSVLGRVADPARAQALRAILEAADSRLLDVAARLDEAGRAAGGILGELDSARGLSMSAGSESQTPGVELPGAPSHEEIVAKAALEADVDACARLIQDHYGNTDGGLAGQFFSGGYRDADNRFVTIDEMWPKMTPAERRTRVLDDYARQERADYVEDKLAKIGGFEPATIDLDSPEGRLAALELLGPVAYGVALEARNEGRRVATFNGYDVRRISTRYGQLFAVGSTGRAYISLEKAEAYAASLPPAPAQVRPVLEASSGREALLAAVAREFPDFPADGLPELPEGFACHAWHNDAMPVFVNPDLGVHLWVDYPDPAKREMQGMARFLLAEGVDHAKASKTIVASDDWSEVAANIEAVRAMRARGASFSAGTAVDGQVDAWLAKQKSPEAAAAKLDGMLDTVEKAVDLVEAHTLKERLERIDGIANVRVGMDSGKPERPGEVTFDVLEGADEEKVAEAVRATIVAATGGEIVDAPARTGASAHVARIASLRPGWRVAIEPLGAGLDLKELGALASGPTAPERAGEGASFAFRYRPVAAAFADVARSVLGKTAKVGEPTIGLVAAEAARDDFHKSVLDDARNHRRAIDRAATSVLRAHHLDGSRIQGTGKAMKRNLQAGLAVLRSIESPDRRDMLVSQTRAKLSRDVPADLARESALLNFAEQAPGVGQLRAGAPARDVPRALADLEATMPWHTRAALVPYRLTRKQRVAAAAAIGGAAIAGAPLASAAFSSGADEADLPADFASWTPAERFFHRASTKIIATAGLGMTMVGGTALAGYVANPEHFARIRQGAASLLGLSFAAGAANGEVALVRAHGVASERLAPPRAIALGRARGAAGFLCAPKDVDDVLAHIHRRSHNATVSTALVPASDFADLGREEPTGFFARIGDVLNPLSMPVSERRKIVYPVAGAGLAAVAALAAGPAIVERATQEYAKLQAAGAADAARESALKAILDADAQTGAEFASRIEAAVREAADALEAVTAAAGDHASVARLHEALAAKAAVTGEAVAALFAKISAIPGIEALRADPLFADRLAGLDAAAKSTDIASAVNAALDAVRGVERAGDALWQSDAFSTQPANHLAGMLDPALANLAQASESLDRVLAAQAETIDGLFAQVRAATVPAPAGDYLAEAVRISQGAWDQAQAGVARAIADAEAAATPFATQAREAFDAGIARTGDAFASARAAAESAAADPAGTLERMSSAAHGAANFLAAHAVQLVDGAGSMLEATRAALGFSAGAAAHPRDHMVEVVLKGEHDDAHDRLFAEIERRAEANDGIFSFREAKLLEPGDKEEPATNSGFEFHSAAAARRFTDEMRALRREGGLEGRIGDVEYRNISELQAEGASAQAAPRAARQPLKRGPEPDGLFDLLRLQNGLADLSKNLGFAILPVQKIYAGLTDQVSGVRGPARMFLDLQIARDGQVVQLPTILVDAPQGRDVPPKVEFARAPRAADRDARQAHDEAIRMPQARAVLEAIRQSMMDAHEKRIERPTAKTLQGALATAAAQNGVPQEEFGLVRPPAAAGREPAADAAFSAGTASEADAQPARPRRRLSIDPFGLAPRPPAPRTAKAAVPAAGGPRKAGDLLVLASPRNPADVVEMRKMLAKDDVVTLQARARFIGNAIGLITEGLQSADDRESLKFGSSLVVEELRRRGMDDLATALETKMKAAEPAGRSVADAVAAARPQRQAQRGGHER